MDSVGLSLENLSSRNTHSARMQGQQVHQLDAGLRSAAGAETIINMIRARRFVNRLIVGHNKLGDEGCCHLFNFLCSEGGRQYNLEEISLNANNIGDEGLLSMSDYLKGNKRLRELFLQNNAFTGKLDVTLAFVAAINSSRLEILSVSSNYHLSDTFLAHFLSELDAPHLRELHCSGIGLTPISGNTIAAYLSSPRCRLQVFKCNGNFLGLRAIKSIIRAIRKCNYSLRSVEFYANRLESGETDSTNDDSDEDSTKENMRTWADCEALLKDILLRNIHLKREVNKQSVALLRCARPLLLHSKRRLAPAVSDAPPQDYTPTYSFERSPPFAFRKLPLELQHHILSFFAPSLSSSQRIHIFNYASSTDTLPLLLPPLSTLTRSVRPGSACIPDPASIEYALGGTVWALKADHNPLYPKCTVDRCMGSSNSLLCRREKERLQFLENVGCDTYELEPGEAARSAREIYTLSLA